MEDLYTGDARHSCGVTRVSELKESKMVSDRNREIGWGHMTRQQSARATVSSMEGCSASSFLSWSLNVRVMVISLYSVVSKKEVLWYPYQLNFFKFD
jgi:hypothetical protein